MQSYFTVPQTSICEKARKYRRFGRARIILARHTFLSQKKRDLLASLIDIDDGFTVMRKANGEWSFYTYYNDELPFKRQRFTIAHEIKHVIYHEETPSDKEEALAEHFARVLLAPSCLVMQIMKDNCIADICDSFNISIEASTYAFWATKRRLNAKGKVLNDYEIEYIDLIESNLNKK